MAEHAQQEFDEYALDYEGVINDYVGFAGQSQDFYTRAKALHLRHLLDERSGAKRLDVLDIGCGHGLIHPHLNGTGYKLTGVDVAEKAIDFARQMNPGVGYDVYDGSRLPYADASFDVAFTICVMHHVPPDQWPAFVTEAKRVLRPGGTFVVFEHNKINPLVQWVVSRIPIDRNAVLLTSWRTQKLLRNASFSEVTCKHILFFPFEGQVFQTVESSLGWLPMGAQYYVAAIK
jgi:SAM-dependent methyltransferase